MKIYISSTFSDLKDCREAVYDALRVLRHDVIAMEDYVATDQRPRDKCLEDVAASDIYVGIFAWRYGYIPTKDNPEQKSITELEFRHAVETGKPCLLFLLHEDASWPVSKMDQGAERIRKLREELSADYTISFFQNCEQLAGLVGFAVTNRLERNHPTSQIDSSKTAVPAPPKVSTSRLPITGRDLFGRERELQMLDDAWAHQDSHVLSLVAWGGVGKSALVNSWLARMAQDDYRGAERVYGWSFYSQGTTDRAVSADQFIEAALVWFGDPEPNKGSPWDKGERLAQFVGAHRTLLVLDGLEPLQYPPGPDEGRLKDQALQALLRQLAASNKGLCVISTRVAVTDLSPFEGRTATRIDLEHLSPEAGAEVLKAQGVKGTQDELEQAAKDFGGHSLALTLLGSYLSDVYGGDVSRRGEISDLEGDVRYGGHAQKVMASYEKWFGEGPELAVLRILGLFNRPADINALAALRAAPAIPGLTDTFQALSETDWQRVLAKLRRARLLAAPNLNQLGTLDTHPLVREHFGQQLKQFRPDAWRQGNSRLYEHLKRTAKDLPETIEEMSPLYAAVAHGCEAGRYQDALDEVYFRRISRGQRFFNLSTLGSFGADLAALSCFYKLPWSLLVDELPQPDKSFVLAQTGTVLRPLGRLAEATQTIQAGLQIYTQHASWNAAANTASNLSQIYIILGNIEQAINYAQKCAEFAQKSEDDFEQHRAQCEMAYALYQAGRCVEAETLLHNAEEKQRLRYPDHRFLYSLGGFYYCDLLLDQGKYQEVLTRAEQTLKLVTDANWLLDIALDNLSLGRAYLLQAQQENTNNFAPAVNHFNLAIDGLRRAGFLDYLVLGLLTRAGFHRISGNINQAQLDLDEAMSIAERGSMGRYQADCYLGYARLYLAQGEKERARASWEKAKEMIERMGYHRRDKDVQEIEQQLEEA